MSPETCKPLVVMLTMVSVHLCNLQDKLKLKEHQGSGHRNPKALFNLLVLIYVLNVKLMLGAWPAPNMKIGAYQSQFSQSDRFEVKSITVGTGVFKTQLLIRNAQVEDSGNFYCTANNTHGFAKEEGIKLIIQQPTEHVIIIIIATWIRDVQDKCFNVFSESRFDAMLQRSRCTAKLSWNLYSKS